MSKNLQGNGLFESSRMMLFEHRDSYNEMGHDRNKKKRIELDEQEWEIISRAIQESIELHKQVTLSLYDEFEDLKAIGIIESVDAHKQRIRIDGEWFKVADIVGVFE